jgi:hypothetical protein
VSKYLTVKAIKLSLIASIILSSSIYAEDGFEDEFGDDEPIVVQQIQKEDKKSFTYYGSVTASTNYTYGKNADITSAKLSGDLNLEYKLSNNYKVKSTLKAFNDFSSNIDDDRNFDINELYLQGSLNSTTDIKIGRQIVVWGKSDNIRITDTLNPMDMTTPGMVDIKDLRLGRAMSKLDYFTSTWAYSAIILHENRYSTVAETPSEYFMRPFPSEPSNSLSNTGLALSANAPLKGQDVAVYFSNQYIDNKSYKSNMLGAAYNKVISSYLIKAEVAYFDNYDSDIVTSKIDALLGMEYNGISDGSISLELANKDDNIQYALRFTQSYINQTLDFTALVSAYGKEFEDGGFVRVWSDYAYSDKIALNFGIIDYIGGENMYFEKIKENDRIFSSIKYSF